MSIQRAKTNKIKRKSIRQLIDRLEKPLLTPIKKQKQVYIDIEEVRKGLKQSWKGADAGNREFAKLQVLKGKMLNSWEIQRMGLSKRSYSTPKQSKGFRYTATSNEFKIKNEKQFHSKPFLQYLSKVQQDYENKLFKDARYQAKNKQVISKLSTNSMKFFHTGSFFGNARQQKGFNTFKSFKSQIIFKKN